MDTIKKLIIAVILIILFVFLSGCDGVVTPQSYAVAFQLCQPNDGVKYIENNLWDGTKVTCNNYAYFDNTAFGIEYRKMNQENINENYSSEKSK